MYIIIRKPGSKPTSKQGRTAFTPHWNTAIDKKPVYISSPRQFRHELERRGLEMAPEGPLTHTPKTKSYTPSDETRKLVKEIRRQSDKKGQFTPSGTLKDTLRKKGILQTKKERAETLKRLPPPSTTGGFYTP